MISRIVALFVAGKFVGIAGLPEYEFAYAQQIVVVQYDTIDEARVKLEQVGYGDLTLLTPSSDEISLAGMDTAVLVHSDFLQLVDRYGIAFNPTVLRKGEFAYAVETENADKVEEKSFRMAHWSAVRLIEKTFFLLLEEWVEVNLRHTNPLVISDEVQRLSDYIYQLYQHTSPKSREDYGMNEERFQLIRYLLDGFSSLDGDSSAYQDLMSKYGYNALSSKTKAPEKL
jgi:hypothetical protein